MFCFNICSLQSRNKFALLPFLYRFIPSLSQPNLTQLNSPHQPVQSALSMKLISGHSSSSKSKFTTQALDLNSRSEVSMGAVQLSAAVYTLQFAKSLACTCLGSSPESKMIFLTLDPVTVLTSPAAIEYKVLIAALLLFLSTASYLVNLEYIIWRKCFPPESSSIIQQ